MKIIISFILIGLIFCFIFRNLFLIYFYSHNREIIDIISSPDLDYEVWYIFLYTYLLTIKVYFNNFFNSFMSEINNINYLNLLIRSYCDFKKTIYFKIIIKIILLLLSIGSFGLGVYAFTNNSPNSIDILNFLLFAYLTFTFNQNYKIIEFKNN